MQLTMEELIDKNTKWIWLPDEKFAVNHWVEFRQTLELDKVGAAQFIIAADTSYQLWINGQLVDDAYFSDFPDDRYYHEIDVTSYLQEGDNCIAVLGYYQGVNTARYVSGKPGVIFELKCDGISVLESNSNCKVRTSNGYLSGEVPFVTVQLGLVVEYDSSKDDGWKSVDYDDSSWSDAIEIASAQEFSGNGLVPYPVKRFDVSYRPAVICSNGILRQVPSEGTFADLISGSDLEKTDDAVGKKSIDLPPSDEGSFVLFDLLREDVGYLQIELEATEATVIDIAHGEHIVDGRVRAKIETRNFADRYIAGSGKQKWSMPVRKLGGRYLELHVRNAKSTVKISSVGINSVEYPTRSDFESFECSDKMIENIMKVSARTAKLCMLENYLDTPWREQALYSLDARNQAVTGYYLFGEYDYPEKCINVLGAGKFCENYLSMCAPSDMSITIPVFTMAWINAIRDYTLYSGREQLANKYFDYTRDFIFKMLGKLKDNVLPIDPSEKYWNFYEWSDGLDGGGPFTEDKTLFHSCKSLLLIEAIRSYNDICSYLDKGQAVEQDVVDGIAKGVHEKFYCTEKELFANEHPYTLEGDFSELTQALAGEFIDLDAQEAQKIKKYIGLGTLLIPATLSMKKYVFDAVDKIYDDDGKSVLDIIRSEWGHMLLEGATTFWETLKGDADFNNAGSLCHGWSIIPSFYIYSEVIGIKPLEPGFKKFEICPKFADLDYVKGAVPTPSGDIKVQWNRSGNVVELEVTHPADLEPILTFHSKNDIVLKSKILIEDKDVKENEET